MGPISFLPEDNWRRPRAVRRLYDIVFEHLIHLLLNDIFLFERRGIGKLVNWFGLFRIYLMRENVILQDLLSLRQINPNALSALIEAFLYFLVG